jgi:hypothetical protein
VLRQSPRTNEISPLAWTFGPIGSTYMLGMPGFDRPVPARDGSTSRKRAAKPSSAASGLAVARLEMFKVSVIAPSFFDILVCQQTSPTVCSNRLDVDMGAARTTKPRCSSNAPS